MPVTGPVRISAVLSEAVVELCLGCLAGQFSRGGAAQNSSAFVGESDLPGELSDLCVLG